MSWYLFGLPSTPIYPLARTPLYNQTLRTIFKALCWPLYILAFIGVGLVARKHKTWFILVWPFLLHTFIVILTYPDGRYMYPNLPIVFLLTALSILYIKREAWPRIRDSITSRPAR
jgi:hypothetical protein